ncbi:MAG TPA: hypothetical protein VI076_08665, partial [Actinopolymorphaceae bacterium]
VNDALRSGARWVADRKPPGSAVRLAGLVGVIRSGFVWWHAALLAWSYGSVCRDGSRYEHPEVERRRAVVDPVWKRSHTTVGTTAERVNLGSRPEGSRP